LDGTRLKNGERFEPIEIATEKMGQNLAVVIARALDEVGVDGFGEPLLRPTKDRDESRLSAEMSDDFQSAEEPSPSDPKRPVGCTLGKEGALLRVDGIDIYVQTTCAGCLHPSGRTPCVKNPTCKRFRRSKLEAAGRARRLAEAKQVPAGGVGPVPAGPRGRLSGRAARPAAGSSAAAPAQAQREPLLDGGPGPDDGPVPVAEASEVIPVRDEGDEAADDDVLGPATAIEEEGAAGEKAPIGRTKAERDLQLFRKRPGSEELKAITLLGPAALHKNLLKGGENASQALAEIHRRRHHLPRAPEKGTKVT